MTDNHWSYTKNGPTGKCSPATTNAPKLCHHRSTTTTINADTAPSEANHRSAERHQPDGQVQLAVLLGWYSDQQALTS